MVVVLTWPPGGALTISAVLVTGALLIWHHGRPFDLSNALVAQSLTIISRNFTCFWLHSIVLRVGCVLLLPDQSETLTRFGQFLPVFRDS